MLSSADNDNSLASSGEPASSKKAVLEQLGRLVTHIENNRTLQPASPASPGPAEAPADISKAPDLLSHGWMHEFWAKTPDSHAAAMAFLLEGLKANHQMILWVMSAQVAYEHGLPYGPGLLEHGIDPARIILVRTHNSQDALWAMDEGLKAGVLAAVVGETAGMSLNASRRLALTAKEHNTRCLHLVRTENAPPSAAYSRWHVTAMASDNPFRLLPGPARLSICPVKHRGGTPPHTHILEWQDETHHFHMVAPLANRPLVQKTTYRHTG